VVTSAIAVPQTPWSPSSTAPSVPGTIRCRVGGVVALILVLGLEATSLAILVIDASPMAAGLACLLAGGVSRAVPVVLVRLSRQRAQPGSLGGWFAARTTNTDAAMVVGSAVVPGLACWWVLGGPAVLAAGASGASAVWRSGWRWFTSAAKSMATSWARPSSCRLH
jgi:hypothetical protein